MLFNSFEYFVFLAGVALLYFALPYRWRMWLLLAGSYYFYMRWRWEYGSLLAGMTLLNYTCARLIARAGSARTRKLWLACAVALSIGLLGVFKYLGFLNDTVRHLVQHAGLNYDFTVDILLPVGISFFTFQALGYTIDVYRGTCDLEKNLGRFALYVSFFPQLVAGPIERAGHLLGQFKRENHLDVVRLSEGGKLIAWGLFKKIVIADNLATYVDRVYASPDLYSGPTLLLATYFFAFQIYCDFSGYSDIAIGSARILGYDLMQNFRLPYFATSIRDFWRRWHISLSSWFADYVYVPLGGSKVTTGRWTVNILAVFLLSGLWHGASWTFVAWGGLHACYYLMEALVGKVAKRFRVAVALPRSITWSLKVFVTFHLVVLAWVFFRAQTLPDAFFIVHRILTDLGGRLALGPSQLETAVFVGLILVLLTVQLLQLKNVAVLYQGESRLPRIVRWSGYVTMLCALTLLSKGSNEFIYFRF